jgi:hypothetical protein
LQFKAGSAAALDTAAADNWRAGDQDRHKRQRRVPSAAEQSVSESQGGLLVHTATGRDDYQLVGSMPVFLPSGLAKGKTGRGRARPPGTRSASRSSSAESGSSSHGRAAAGAGGQRRQRAEQDSEDDMLVSGWCWKGAQRCCVVLLLSQQRSDNMQGTACCNICISPALQ